MFIYNDVTQLIVDTPVNFSDVIGFKQFLSGSSVSNNKGKLIITGGFINEKEFSNVSLLYDGASNKLISFPRMLSKRANHSSCIVNGNVLYISGGRGTKSIECFDFNKYSWKEVGKFNLERENALLYNYKHYLYTFFGVRNNEYLDSIERFDLNTSRLDIIKYTPKNLDLKLRSCGYIKININSILILGGKYKDKYNRDNLFQFDFLKNVFSLANNDLENDLLFNDPNLYQLKDTQYANFNGNDNNFFKISLE